MIGSLIAGRYRLDSVIGEGGVAVVYKARDTVLDRDVAVKVLRPEMAENPEVVGRFRREAHAAAKLNHPNIVQIYDTGVDGDKYFIVMEYLPEPDLKRIIKEYAPLPLKKVLEVSIQCARALAYAHKQGLVHRDVKPHNILFTDEGRPKLSDFGIAAAIGEGGLTEAGLVLGSAYYISPEQAQGAPATAQSDIYSLGVVMYECLTGRPPFTGATAAEIAAKHVRERPPALRTLNPNVTPSFEYVVNKAMARELTRRYRTADELLIDLEKLADGVELDRTGVLSPGSEEATLRLSPAQAPTAPSYVPPPAGGEPARPQPPQPGNVAFAAALAVIIALLGLVGVFFLIKMAFYPGESAKKVQVRSVKGLTLAEATTLLSADGLKVGKVTYQESDTDKEGTIIRQIPEAGETVAPGASVDLWIAQGKKLATVPDVRRRTIAEATDRLRAANLQLGEIEEVYNSEIPAGQIIKQAISAGTKVEAGTAVDVTVSRGPEPQPQVVSPPEETTPLAEDPVVEVVRDTSFKGKNERERKFVVTVTATGKQRGQKIQILKTDDEGRAVEVGSDTLDPGASRKWEVVVTGNATIEVYQNGRVVFSDQYLLEAAP